MQANYETLGVILDNEEAVVAETAMYNLHRAGAVMPEANEQGQVELDAVQSQNLADAFAKTANGQKIWANALVEHLVGKDSFGIYGLIIKSRRLQMKQLEQEIGYVRMNAAVYKGLSKMVKSCLDDSQAEVSQKQLEALAS